MRDQVCVCHTHFDRVSIAKAFAKYGLDPFPCDWLDSARVARRAWQQFAFKGYGLANVCKEIGYQFQHHDALEDAKAAGVVLLAAIEETGIPLEKWPTRVSQPSDPNYTSKHRKAEQLASQGQRIRILKESDFLGIVGSADSVQSGR